MDQKLEPLQRVAVILRFQIFVGSTFCVAV